MVIALIGRSVKAAAFFVSRWIFFLIVAGALPGLHEALLNVFAGECPKCVGVFDPCHDPVLFALRRRIDVFMKQSTRVFVLASGLSQPHGRILAERQGTVFAAETVVIAPQLLRAVRRDQKVESVPVAQFSGSLARLISKSVSLPMRVSPPCRVR